MKTVYEQAQSEAAKMIDQALYTAYAVVAVLGLKEDDVSQAEAYKLYDRGWIIDRTKRGMLHFTRKGATAKSAKIYSRFEIESLRRAEKHIQEAFEEVERRASRLVQQS